MPLLARLKPRHLMPGFNELVFLAFVILSFVDQAVFAPRHIDGSIVDAVERAIAFVIPGQHALVVALAPCTDEGGRVFASAFAWMLALIFFASALSRIRLAAGLVRLERSTRPETLGPAVLAGVLFVAALAGIQLLFVGTALRWLDCSQLAGLPGAFAAGLAPLMLSYLIVAALTALLAVGPER
jgi:hypothetical protein